MYRQLAAVFVDVRLSTLRLSSTWLAYFVCYVLYNACCTWC